MSVDEPEILPPEQPTLYCSECGGEVYPSAVRCASCGRNLREPEAKLPTYPFAPITSKNRKRSRMIGAEICAVLFITVFYVLYIGMRIGLIPAWIPGHPFGSPIMVYLIGLSILVWLILTDKP
ncbi:MAG: hypothetical protein WCF54_18585 [Terracidiphilus sp.]